jgi:hypothetical protein
LRDWQLRLDQRQRPAEPPDPPPAAGPLKELEDGVEVEELEHFGPVQRPLYPPLVDHRRQGQKRQRHVRAANAIDARHLIRAPDAMDEDVAVPPTSAGRRGDIDPRTADRRNAPEIAGAAMGEKRALPTCQNGSHVAAMSGK